MLIVRTTNTDIFWNLAVEEYLLGLVDRHPQILFLWQSRDAVVIGKNQIPWRECRMKLLMEDDVPMGRRVSGGGAVFHDMGNLNYTLVTRRGNYSSAWTFQTVLDALKNLGIEARVQGRSLMADGRKFSGNAFCFRGDAALHHGTMLISSDLDQLNRYLEPSESVIRSRAIRSVPSLVVNLQELRPDVTVERVASALLEAFQSAYGDVKEFVTDGFQNNKAVTALYRKQMSWEWQFGNTPPFDIEMQGEFEWGMVRARLFIQRGAIVDAAVVIEGRNEAFGPVIEERLTGSTLEPDELFSHLKTLPPDCDERIAVNLAEWILSAGA